MDQWDHLTAENSTLILLLSDSQEKACFERLNYRLTYLMTLAFTKIMERRHRIGGMSWKNRSTRECAHSQVVRQ